MIRRTLIMCAMLFMAPSAITETSYKLDCGTLSGKGVVRLYIGDVAYRVDIDCGVRV